LKGTFVIFKALIKVWLRSKTGIFFSFLFPLMLLLTFGTVFGGGQAAKYQLYIQNFDVDDNGEPTELSKTLIKALNSTESFDIKNLDVKVNITEYMRAHPSFTSYRFLIIPEGFQQKAMNKTVSARVGVIIDTLLKIEEMYGKYMDEESRQRVKEGREALSAWRNRTLTAEEAEILLLTEEGDTSAPTIKGIVYSVINALNNALVGAEEIVSVTSKPIVEKRLTAADYYLPGYIAAFIMTNGIIGVTSNVAEYRRKRGCKEAGCDAATKKLLDLRQHTSADSASLPPHTNNACGGLVCFRYTLSPRCIRSPAHFHRCGYFLQYRNVFRWGDKGCGGRLWCWQRHRLPNDVSIRLVLAY
jgi:ABC-2 type transport system permease protein